MKHKTSQSGFTLIELIAVMVILGILAAVIIPRISTLTSGAYESNVRAMYGVIKNEVNAQAIKAAMSGGASGHLETYPEITASDVNGYLMAWVEEFEGDYWYQNAATTYTDANNVAGNAVTTPAAIFWYMPHGLGSSQINAVASTAGTSTSNEDIYFIWYAPHTTTQGKLKGRNFDGFILKAFKNKALDQVCGLISGVIEGVTTETLIVDLDWTTPND